MEESIKPDAEIYSFEKGWWWDCLSTLGEEQKQLTYAKKMGLNLWGFGPGMVHDLNGKSVLDIGGGPVSLLLKTIHRGKNCIVVDPIEYPHWTVERYKEGGIKYIQSPGENILNIKEINSNSYDEVWIYNVLQHTIDPERIINNAKTLSKCIRIFEWIDIPAHEGHPQELKQHLLDSWLEGEGSTEILTQDNLHGKSYYGTFKYD